MSVLTIFGLLMFGTAVFVGLIAACVLTADYLDAHRRDRALRAELHAWARAHGLNPDETPFSAEHKL